MYNKKGQEEIAGFMIIVVIVTIILLFFLVFSLQSNNEAPASYEASSFLQSMLSYTTSCERSSGFLSVDDLIVACYREESCGNEDSCVVLNQTLQGIIEESWTVGPEAPYKGYMIEALSGEERVFSISAGNSTNTYKGATPQVLPVSGITIIVYFKAYL